MDDYRELCETLRLANSWQFAPKFVNAMLDAADAIEQLAKERDALTKCFRITRTDERLTNHAVFKIDYRDIIDKTADELVYVIALGLARAVRGEVNE